MTGTVLLPSASYRIAVATRYWHAARIIISSQIRPAEFMEPVGYLLGMSVELALKAYLLNFGFAEKTLSQKGKGHDLGALLRLCLERHLKLAQEDVMVILIMRVAHIEHFHRYGPGDFSRFPMSILLAEDQNALFTAARLIDSISGDPQRLRTLHQHSEEIEWPETPVPCQPVKLKELSKIETDVVEHARRIRNIGEQYPNSSI